MFNRRNAAAIWLFSGSAALLTAALVVTAPLATGVGEDVTSPTAHVEASFLVGSTIGPSNLRDNADPGNSCGPGGENDWTSVAYRVKYGATDPSDIFHFDRWRVYAGTYPDFLGYYFSDEGKRFDDRLSDDHGDCGGGSLEPVGWAVTAYDGADNAKYVETTGRRPYVVQENGRFATEPPFAPVIKLSPGWRSSICTCASGGRQVFTRQAGATASIRLADGGDVALVMATGPGRGRAAIVVDGVQVGTVDTHAPADANRVIVWSETLSPGVSHVVKIKNLGTAGRSRIDFDALVL